MASAELSARLCYLNDSAHVLAKTAPTTSRHLISRRNALMFENELDPSEAQRRNACGTCGTIMILGWEGTMQTETQLSRGKKLQPHGQGAKPTKALIYNCETCGRKSRFPLNHPSQTNRHRSVSSNSRPISTSQFLTRPNSASSALEAKPGSKKRTKARKRGGLEALLASRKIGPESSGFGIDLMDLMKKS
jgi:RNase P subunit RPR2